PRGRRRQLTPKSTFSTGPARRTTSHSVICSAIPPVTGAAAGAAPAAADSAKPCSGPAAHCPSGPTKSAAVIGRSSKLLLPPENVAQSGFLSMGSGLGTSVTLFRLRSDEHAPSPTASTASATADPSARIVPDLATPITFNRERFGPRPLGPSSTYRRTAVHPARSLEFAPAPSP